MSTAFTEFVESIQLIDHHVHGAFRANGDEVRFQNALNEGNSSALLTPQDSYDSQLGFAIRRWCAEPLGLPPHASADEYWARRQQLGEAELTRILLTQSGVSDWLIDTGYKSAEFMSPTEMTAASGNRSHEIVRLEIIAESVILDIANASNYANAFAQKLGELASTAVGAKTVIAYRGGFDQNLEKPTTAAVTESAARWLAELDTSSVPRLADITLIAHGIHAALTLQLPLQFHVGFGDRDLDLNHANPLLLTPFLRTPEAAQSSIMLLHCYPFEREAGYLAQAFDNVYLDVGLATNFLGARSRDLVARALELAPFSKILYSSDAYGPAELHYLGARLWRSAIGSVVGRWIDADDWSLADAKRVTTLVARENAERVYSLT